MSQDMNNAIDQGADATKDVAISAKKVVKKARKKAKKKAKKKAGKTAAKAGTSVLAAAGPWVILAIVGIIIIIIVFGATGPGMTKTEYLTANNEKEMNEPKEDEADESINDKSVSQQETAELIGIIQEAKEKERDRQIENLKQTAKQYDCDPELTVNNMTDETATSLSDASVSAASIKASAAKTKIWKFLKANGYSDAAAAGIMGNIQAESGFRPDAIEASTGEGHGLCQWSFGRKTNLFSYAAKKGKKWSDIDVQLDFLMTELNNGYRFFSSKEFKKTTDCKWAADQFVRKFERPANVDATSLVRQANALAIYNLYKGIKADGLRIASTSSASGTSTSSSDSAFFDALTSVANDVMKNKFKYNGGCSHNTYNSALHKKKNGKKCVNCASYVSWSLQAAGLVPKGTYFYIQNGTIHGKAKYVKRMKNKDNFYTREHLNITLKKAITSGKVKPGDIVGWARGQGEIGAHTMVYRGKIKGKFTFFSVGGSTFKTYKPSNITNKVYGGSQRIGVIIRPKKAGSFATDTADGAYEPADEATREDFDILAAYSVSVGNSEMELVDEEGSKESSDGKSVDDSTYTDITGKKIPLYWFGEKRGTPNYQKDLKRKLKKSDTPFYDMVYETDSNNKVKIVTVKNANGKESRYLKATLKERDITKASKTDKKNDIKAVCEAAFDVKPKKQYAGTGNTNAKAIKGIGEESYQLLGKGDDSVSEIYGSGQFAMPLGKTKYTLTSRFGVDRGYENHPGCDMAAPTGTKIYAAADGIVTVAGRYGGYGNCVVINHGGGLQSLYGHMVNGGIEVKKNDRVVKGQLIGHVGSTGWSTGPHLHFEVRRKGIAVDPSPYINKNVGSSGWKKKKK